jgi:multidrug resistance efflux pump
MVTNQQREIQSKLKMLRKELDRNEELMRHAAISYEDLMAAKETLQLTIDGLRKSQKEMREREINSVAG